MISKKTLIGCENEVVVYACEKHTDNQTVLFMIIIIVLCKM